MLSSKQHKNLVLIGAPPGCGKTFYAGMLADGIPNSVVLDLDSLNPLSAKLCMLCGQEFDKGGDFFRRNVRDTEYETLLDLAFSALQYNRTVIVSAPFTKEFRHPELLEIIRRKAEAMGASLVPVWVQSSQNACRENMIQRNLQRDKWKLSDLDAYIESIDLNAPKDIDDLYIIDARERGNETQNITGLIHNLFSGTQESKC